MNLHLLATSAAWTALGWTMVHLVWVGLLVGVLAALARRALRRSRPEARHGVAVACLLALTAAPFVIFPCLYRPSLKTSRTVAMGQVAPNVKQAKIDPAQAPMSGFPHRDFGPKTKTSSLSFMSRIKPLVGYLPGVWLFGSLTTFVLVAAGLCGVERLRRSSQSLDAGPIAEHCRKLAVSLGIARRVGVAVCDRIAAPIVVGIVRPLVLLPPAALNGWSIDLVEMALLHELAHVRRHDNLVALVQRLAESLLFFHPVAWWLSSWIGLERELCCDQVVIGRTKEPHAYARMLAALAEIHPQPHTAALAMAERPLMTRIRRILNMEDRSMKLTMPEGLGLLAAVVVGSTLALAARAEPARHGSAKQALEQMARDVIATSDAKEGYDMKGLALVSIARAQLQLGDRAAALATLHRLDRLATPPARKPGTKANLPAWMRYAALVESAELRRDAGDIDDARAVLRRAARDLDLLDNGTVHDAVDRLSQEIDHRLGEATKDGSLRRVRDEEAALITEISTLLIDQCIILGEKDLARTLIHRQLESIGPPKGPIKALIVAEFGNLLIKAGDVDGGRALIERARQAVPAPSDPKAKQFVLPKIAEALFDAGLIDEALAEVQKMPPSLRHNALDRALERIAGDRDRAWRDPVGINGDININASDLDSKVPASARARLSKIAAAARELNDAKARARTLGFAAHLQARAGDFAGALATARSISLVKRPDFPGPNDGLYGAVKPVAFAMIADAQAEAGDRANAAATLDEAQAIAKALPADDQKFIALIAIARTWTACGRPDAAKADLNEALPLALAQSEPRRSRFLAVLVETPAWIGDEAGALKVVELIREQPALEKVRALSVLAQRYEETGDTTTAQTLLRRAVTGLETKGPAPKGKTMPVAVLQRRMFVDFDLEMDPKLLDLQRESIIQDFRIRMGDVESVVRTARALPAPKRDAALARAVVSLAEHGDVDEAMKLAKSMDADVVRMSVFNALAAALPQGQARK